MKRAFGLVFLLVFFFSLWSAGMDEAAEAGLPEKLLRLRVVAQSDSPADQTDKLLVRDAVLRALRPMLEDCADLEEVRAVAARALPQLAEAAAGALEADRAIPLTLRLGTETCPRRAYEDFTLPAGEYETLTVTLGSGEGHNWWCVVFPPLCLAAAEEAGEDGEEEEWSVFSPAEKRLITSGVELRFRCLELLRKLRARTSS